MKAVTISHKLDGTERNLITSGVLVVAVCAVLLSFFWFQQTQQLLTGLEKEKADYEQSLQQKRVEKPLNEQQKQELTAVNEALSAIREPWPERFAALESAKVGSIDMLSVEPDKKKRSVHITAVTTNVEQLLDYLNLLKQQTVFNSVDLVSTQQVRIGGKARLQFDVVAVW